MFFSSFSRATACVNTSVLFCNQTLCTAHVYLVFCLSVHWRTLAYFHLTDAINSHIEVSVWTCIFMSLGRAGDSMFTCLKSFQVVLWGGSVPLHLPTGNIWRFGFFPHPQQHFATASLFEESHPGGWVVSHCGLICVSLVVNGMEHLFMCTLAVSIIRVMWHFLYLCSTLAVCIVFSAYKSSLYFLAINLTCDLQTLPLSLW